MDKNRQLLEIQENDVKVDDFVRIKLKKSLFSKLGRNYSQEIYKVIKVNKFSVKLERDNGEPYDKLVRIDDIQVVPSEMFTTDSNDNIKEAETNYKVVKRLHRELGPPLINKDQSILVS